MKYQDLFHQISIGGGYPTVDDERRQEKNNDFYDENHEKNKRNHKSKLIKGDKK